MSHVLGNVTVTTGGHCESSAIMNALLYEGYDVSECMITGGGGALSFVFMKGTFPFLGARNDDMKERFFEAAGIAFHDVIPKGKDYGWTEIDSLLERGIPVVLRNDMRFLRYRYGGKYGSSYTSFGGHLITLFGIDRGKNIAWVSDTEYPGLQTVSLADLHKARTSTTKNFPPQAEYYWAEPPVGAASDSAASARAEATRAEAAKIDPDALLRSSLATVARNYEQGALAGLELYGADLASLETYSKQKFLMPAVFDYMSGNIESFGTGGASFRMLYRAFLTYEIINAKHIELSPLVPLLDDCIASWHELSSEFRTAAKAYKSLSPDGKASMYNKLRNTADELHGREKRFYTELRKISQEIVQGGLIMLTTGEFSSATRLTVKALRIYHEEGLLVPEKIDAVTGYRYYGDESFRKANAIILLRELGFSIGEMTTILSSCKDEDELVGFFTEKLQEVEREMLRIRDARNRISYFIESGKEDDMSKDLEICERDVKDIPICGIRFIGTYPEIGSRFGELMKKAGTVYQRQDVRSLL